MKKMEIWFDMDGVLANFEKEPNAVDRFAVEKGFFYRLKPIRKNVRFIRYLIKKGYNVNIISASPNRHADKCKRLWLKKYVPELHSHKIVLCRNSDKKSDFVENIKNTILIDDYSQNLIDWKNKGGNVIKFLNNYDSKKGIHKLYKIPYTKNLKKVLKAF